MFKNISFKIYIFLYKQAILDRIEPPFILCSDKLAGN